MVSVLLGFDEFRSDSVCVDISCDGSSEIGDNGDGEIVWSSVVYLDAVPCSDDVGLSVVREGERCLWFVDEANPGKSISSFKEVYKYFGCLL